MLSDEVHSFSELDTQISLAAMYKGRMHTPQMSGPEYIAAYPRWYEEQLMRFSRQIGNFALSHELV